MRPPSLILVAALVAGLVLVSPCPSQAQTAAPAATKTWNLVAGNWKRLKGSVKRRWGKLTHNDIVEANGRRDILAGKIQARYGIDKAKADAQIEEWLKEQK